MNEQFVYKAEHLTFSKELGHGADVVVAQELVDEISDEWRVSTSVPEHPVLIVIGGVQGSGKTTTLEAMRQSVDVLAVSTDVIRHKLLVERKVPISEQMTQTLNATRNGLLRAALSTGHHIMLDQNATRPRIELVQHLLKESGFENYDLKRIYLNASADTLRARVGSREALPGKYTGTLVELENVLKLYGQPDYDLYDIVFNTERLSPQEIAQALLANMK